MNQPRCLKILVLSSLYPPYYIGGYELGCADVVNGLRERGHDVAVLTSTYGIEQPRRDGWVQRSLMIDVQPVSQSSIAKQWHIFRRELHNLRTALHVAHELQPDIIYVWSIQNTSLALVRLLQRAGYRAAFFVSDMWPTHPLTWDSFYCVPRHPVRHLLRRGYGLLLRVQTGFRERMLLHLDHAQFASQHLLDAVRAEVPAPHAHVIHWGVDTARFFVDREPQPLRRRLLYVGQVVPHKGVDTLLRAVALLHTRYGDTDLSVSIVGGSIIDNYVAQLQTQARELGISHLLNWVGKLPREELPAIYAEHDILVFPSRWDEPFSITVVEALAAGLVVVASATGGTPEIIEHEHTGMLFARDDHAACAEHIDRVLGDVELALRLRSNAQHAVRNRFTLATMIDQIETALLSVVG